MTMPDHYAVLGVAHDADRETIRRAYVEIARATHPDRASGDSSARADASRRIRAANAAWTVLGDDRRRADYDRRRRGDSPTVPRATPAAPRTRVVDRASVASSPAPAGTSPWAWVGVAVLVLAIIAVLVVSAYATASDPSTSSITSTSRSTYDIGDCVDVRSSSVGRSATVLPCATATSGRIIAVVDSPRPCPSGTAVELADARTTLCLEPVR